MMKLFYAPKTRANRPRWMLEELGVPYELVRLDVSAQQHKSEDYARHHPLGQVPAFVDGDRTIIESAAICLYLADKYPDKHLAPPLGTIDRGLYYQWAFYAMATIEPPLMAISDFKYPRQGTQPDAAAGEAAILRFKEVARPLETALSHSDFLVGGAFSAADVVVGSVLGWANSMKQLEGFPRLADYARKLLERPAARRARAD